MGSCQHTRLQLLQGDWALIYGDSCPFSFLWQQHIILNNNLQAFQITVLARYLLGVPKAWSCEPTCPNMRHWIAYSNTWYDQTNASMTVVQSLKFSLPASRCCYEPGKNLRLSCHTSWSYALHSWGASCDGNVVLYYHIFLIWTMQSLYSYKGADSYWMHHAHKTWEHLKQAVQGRMYGLLEQQQHAFMQLRRWQDWPFIHKGLFMSSATPVCFKVQRWP